MLEIRAQAAQFRTAATTCTCWRLELEALNAARRDYGPVLNQSIKAPGKLLDFSWWQTEAYADVLNRAVAETAALMGPVTKSVQESAYVSLLDHHVPVSLATLLLPRLRKHCKNIGLNPDGRWLKDEMNSALAQARRTSAQAGWALVRTWCNGWPTSSRMGGKVAECVFGCKTDKPADSLMHYIVCEKLWRPILEEFGKVHGDIWEASACNSLCIDAGESAHKMTDECRFALLAAITVAVDVYNVWRHGARRNLPNVVQSSISRFQVSGTIRLDFKGLRRSHWRDYESNFTRTDSIDMSPASDPNLESTAPLTPRVPPVWDISTPDDFTPRVKTFETFHSSLCHDSVNCDATFNSAASSYGVLGTDGRDFCEPECGEMPRGTHHPCCSQFFLLDIATAARVPPC